MHRSDTQWVTMYAIPKPNEWIYMSFRNPVSHYVCYSETQWVTLYAYSETQCQFICHSETQCQWVTLYAIPKPSESIYMPFRNPVTHFVCYSETQWVNLYAIPKHSESLCMLFRNPASHFIWYSETHLVTWVITCFVVSKQSHLLYWSRAQLVSHLFYLAGVFHSVRNLQHFRCHCSYSKTFRVTPEVLRGHLDHVLRFQSVMLSLFNRSKVKSYILVISFFKDFYYLLGNMEIYIPRLSGLASWCFM